MDRFKVLIINHFGTNKGDAAILIGTVETIKKSIPNIDVVVESSDPEITVERTHGHAGVVERVVERSYGQSKLLWILKTAFWALQSTLWGVLRRYGFDISWMFSDKKKRLLCEYSSSDVILSGGGGYIRDNSGLVGYLPLFSIFLANLIRKPVFVYANSIGPINTRSYSLLSRWILNGTKLITLRDSVSKDVVSSLGISKPFVCLTSDAAFLFHQDVDIKRAEDILKNEDINMDYPLVGITVLRWHYPGYLNPSEKDREYRDSVSKMSDYLIDKYGVNVVFFSMNTDVQRESEIQLAREIVHSMKNKEKAKIIHGEYTPEELKDMISLMDVMVGTRFHSVIFALTVGIPVVAIMYEHKAVGIMKMLQIDDYVCDIHDLESDVLVSLADKVWLKREEIKDYLPEKVIELQKLALMNASFLSVLLNSQNNLDVEILESILSKEERAILSIYNN